MMPNTIKQTISTKRDVAVREESKKMQALKNSVNLQIQQMRKEFMDDGMGFKTL